MFPSNEDMGGPPRGEDKLGRRVQRPPANGQLRSETTFMVTESLAASANGSVSLRCGIGRLLVVVPGALAIGIDWNRMKSFQVKPCPQTAVIGLLLIFPVVVDLLRYKPVAKLRECGRTNMAAANNCDMGEGFGICRCGDGACITLDTTLANAVCDAAELSHGPSESCRRS